MSSLQLLCLYKQPPLFASFSRQLLLHSDHNAIFKERMKLIRNNPFTSIISSYYYCSKVKAVKEDSSSSQQYEIDPEKAREALKKLDQEIQSLSNKPIPSPKVTVSDQTNNNVETQQKELEISESFLGSIAAGLVLFTIFYNVIFYTIIKPSIDASY